MLKKWNNFIERIGADKLLHFLLFAWIVAEAKMFGETTMWVAYFIMAVLSAVKEFLDDTPDKNDFNWGLLGGGVSVILSYLV